MHKVKQGQQPTKSEPLQYLKSQLNRGWYHERLLYSLRLHGICKRRIHLVCNRSRIHWLY